MNDNGKGILGDRDATAEDVRQAWEFAATSAMKEHVKSGEPVVTWDWETHQVALVPPEVFVSPEDPAVAKVTVRSSGR